MMQNLAFKLLLFTAISSGISACGGNSNDSKPQITVPNNAP